MDFIKKNAAKVWDRVEAPIQKGFDLAGMIIVAAVTVALVQKAAGVVAGVQRVEVVNHPAE